MEGAAEWTASGLENRGTANNCRSSSLPPSSNFAPEAEIVTRTADNCVLGGAVPPWCISEDAAEWTATSLESWGTGNHL